MKIYLLILVKLLFCLNVFSQQTFDLLIKTNEDEELNRAIEYSNGTLLLAGGYMSSNNLPISKQGYLVKIDNTGKIINEYKIIKNDTSIEIKDIIKVSETEFVVFSTAGSNNEDVANIIIIQKFDISFNLIKEKIYKVLYPEKNIFFIKTLFDSHGDFIVVGHLQVINDYSFSMFLLKFNNNFEIINSNFVDNEDAVVVFAYDIIEKKSGLGYYCLSRRGPAEPKTNDPINRVLNLNNNLDIISSRTLPARISNEGNLKWFNDTSFITSGFRYMSVADTRNLSVLITDTLHTEYKNNWFGYSDKEEIMSPFGSLIYEENDEFIYLSGNSNYDIYSAGFSNNPSFIQFVKLNRNLEPVFEKYYKGDVCYFNNFVKKTNDGGFLFLTTRYDHTIQNNERDIYILKVDADGNLPVSIENPKIKSRELIIYPNPSTTNLNIRTAVQRIGGEFIMYDITGKQILHQKITQAITTINTNNLSKGTYIYKYIYKAKEIESGKWIKQ